MPRIFSERLSCLLREHWLIITHGSIVAAIVVSPFFFTPVLLGDEYRGINSALFGRDEKWYLSQGRDVLEGRGLGSPVLREGKDGQNFQFTYAIQVILVPLRFLGIGDPSQIVALYRLATVIGVLALNFLIYALLRRFTDNKVLATLTAVAVTAGYPIVLYKTLFHPEPLFYGRAFSPLLGSLAFFLFCNALVASVHSVKQRYVFLAGAALGVTFYVYFWAWTYSLSVACALFLVYGIKKEWGTAKRVALIAALGVALGSVNLYRLYEFFHSPLGEQFSYFSWSAPTHAPVWSSMSFFAAALLLFFVLKRYRAEAAVPFFSAMVLSDWIVVNQQVITGRMIQITHYYWYFIVPTTVIMGVYLFWSVVRAWRYRIAAAMLFLFVIEVNAFVGEYRAIANALPQRQYEQNYRPLLDALARDALPGVVLAADEDDEYLVTAYTGHDLFWNSTGALISHPSPEHMRHALFVYMYLNKESRDDFAGYLTRQMANATSSFMAKSVYQAIEGSLSGYDFFTYNDKVGTNAPEILAQRQTLLASLAGEYKKLKERGEGIAGLLRRYGVNYVVFDKNKNVEWDLSVLPGLAERASNHDIHLYTF